MGERGLAPINVPTGKLAVAIALFLAINVTLLIDWTPTALNDPARAIGTAPLGMAALGAQPDRPTFGPAQYLGFLAVAISYIACGALAARARAPGSTAPLLYVTGLIWLLGGFKLSSNSIAFTFGAVMSNMYTPVLIHLGMTFPRGTLYSRGQRLFVTFSYAFFGLAALLMWSFFDPAKHIAHGETTSRNLLLVVDAPSVTGTTGSIFAIAHLAIGAIVIGILTRRWRNGSLAYRRAFLPLWMAFVTLAITKLAFMFVPRYGGGDVVSWLFYAAKFWAPALIPIAVVVGLAHYRIARAAVGHLMGQIGDKLPTTDVLVKLVRQALHDPVADLYVWSDAVQDYTNSRHQPIDFPRISQSQAGTELRRGDVRLGFLVYDCALAQQPELLDAVRVAVTLLLENGRLTASLEVQVEETRKSRERIVNASDTARRRLERDIHDGAQQQLVAAALTFRRAARNPDPAKARHTLEEGSELLEQAIVNLRELARGLHPPCLQERGLDAALAWIHRLTWVS